MSQSIELYNTNQSLAAIPEHLRGEAGNRDGKDGLGDNDMLIPRLKLAQSMTPERKRTNENYNPDLQEGEFFNSVTGEVYGTTVKVIPLHFFEEHVEFDEETRKPIRIYERGELPAHKDLQYTNGVKPKVTTFKCRMSLLLKEDGTVEPIVVGFKYVGKTKTPTSKWNTLIQEKNFPSYAYSYILESVGRTNDKGDYFSGKFTRGEFTPVELFQSAKEFYSALQESGVKVDMVGIEPDGVEDTTGPTTFDAEQF
jgi:hypothetical protein